MQTILGLLYPTTKFMHIVKYNADGFLERLKAWLFAKGFIQEEGIDYTETYCPVIKVATVRLGLALATMNHWMINQLDVKNAFLHGNLNETMYMQEPLGFISQSHPTFVCKLNKALYGLKQAPRVWFDRFSTFLFSQGFYSSLTDSSLFILYTPVGMIVLLLYVDAMLVTGTSP